MKIIDEAFQMNNCTVTNLLYMHNNIFLTNQKLKTNYKNVKKNPLPPKKI